MIMQHAQDIATAFGDGEKVKDCVITVLSNFFPRQPYHSTVDHTFTGDAFYNFSEFL